MYREIQREPDRKHISVKDQIENNDDDVDVNVEYDPEEFNVLDNGDDRCHLKMDHEDYLDSDSEDHYSMFN